MEAGARRGVWRIVIAVDTNLLVYAHRADSPFHAAALRAVVGLAESGQRWGIPWPCVHEFIAITTHPRIYLPPTSLEVALQAMDVWLAAPHCETLTEGPGYWDVLRGLCRKASVRGPVVHDARVAALCLHHGVAELWSADRDFTRFPALRVRNPL